MMQLTKMTVVLKLLFFAVLLRMEAIFCYRYDSANFIISRHKRFKPLQFSEQEGSFLIYPIKLYLSIPACQLLSSKTLSNNNFFISIQNFGRKVFKRLLQFAVLSATLQFCSVQTNQNYVFAQFQLSGIKVANADDELAQYAAEGNKVGVDGQCFIKKCALETTRCANDPSANCLKGLACLARYNVLHNFLTCWWLKLVK